MSPEKSGRPRQYPGSTRTDFFGGGENDLNNRRWGPVTSNRSPAGKEFQLIPRRQRHLRPPTSAA